MIRKKLKCQSIFYYLISCTDHYFIYYRLPKRWHWNWQMIRGQEEMRIHKQWPQNTSHLGISSFKWKLCSLLVFTYWNIMSWNYCLCYSPAVVPLQPLDARSLLAARAVLQTANQREKSIASSTPPSSLDLEWEHEGMFPSCQAGWWNGNALHLYSGVPQFIFHVWDLSYLSSYHQMNSRIINGSWLPASEFFHTYHS